MWGINRASVKSTQLAWESAMRSHEFWSVVKRHSNGRLFKDGTLSDHATSKLEELERRFPSLKGESYGT